MQSLSDPAPLLQLAGVLVSVAVVVRVILSAVVVHPLVEVVGNVKAAVIVCRELEV